MTPWSAAYGVERPHDLRGEGSEVDPLGRLLDVLELRREQQVGDDVGHGLGVVDELVDLGQRVPAPGRAPRRPRGGGAASGPGC